MSIYEKGNAIYCKTMDGSGAELEIKLVTCNVTAPELMQAVQEAVEKVMKG